MRYSVKVEVRFKDGLLDPEGEATRKALKGLKFPVDDVRLSKVFRMDIDSDSKDGARRLAEDMCRKLLANPNKDDYIITVEENG